MSIYPVILSGGSGTRLWPLSRKHYPKQLLSLTSDKSLLQETLNRVTGKNFEAPLVICNDQHRFSVAEQVRQINLYVRDIILEPIGRNTAPAAAIAALTLRAIDKDATILLLPSDHLISNTKAFQAAIKTAAKAAKNDYLVTFGIKPTGPETGYGYILGGDEISTAPGCLDVEKFIEKPDPEKAAKMIAAGGHVWNSGIFLFKASAYLEELKALQPEVYTICEKSMAATIRDLDFTRMDGDIFETCPAISIDYAVMEHTRKACVVPVDMGWSDIGSWSELWKVSDKDKQDNVVIGDVFAEDTTGSYLRTYNKMIATVGVKDMVIVDTGDTVLVAPRDRAQDIGAIVKRLDKEGRTEHLLPGRVRRPWGWYQSLDSGPSFQVKRICVNPDSRLSLQRHQRRAEHWIVVSGEALVHCDGKDMTLGPNQSTYIPVGAAHRLENITQQPLYLIEVQSGDYLGEDDIERLDDDFARN
ncbi:MAG: mannose-1-phosphate guanylyltransferase/mannose-6-phosphate isomerase [Rhodospirillaceae bacterium]|jgi:mannose-1-phosphate guanylyltransferase / mannose-6-phosphate isomerase|nr:mannose-1-phosphate guanylyltransferase/mannose-6-phosphate isomerase [Rhodospirillaceae bacterium]MBT5244827.1 mannose-1-phosphate guanylyltransferase/mannose-6-phosphate isomerase [Rhodospirillaceae bacterium]MBT5563606.1 mannose-1-phosphate guanylyltransferase/mannose-6-phosphate isomerase [Rhodospirillaceae bacterium]MBT6241438.1 mannose-1-phosphate guanylyltransferase/mannose-6-phosphate isomerase [Rhodospirillaceae bacterium]MBT7138859.1 mannose-1-phosphate guanylyltransferase/mannose-